MTFPDTIYLRPEQRSSNILMAVSNSLRKDTDIAYVKQTIIDEVIAKISARDAEIERLNRLLQEAYRDPEENSGIP